MFNITLLVTGHEKQTAILPQVQSLPLQFPVVPRKVASNSSKLSLNNINSINEQNPLLPSNYDILPYSPCNIEISLMRKSSLYNNVSSL